MRKNTNHYCIQLFLSTLLLVMMSTGAYAGTHHSVSKKKQNKEKLSVDGPYILNQADGSVRIISVNEKREIEDTTYVSLPKDFNFRVTDHKGRYPFEVQLHSVNRPDWQYTHPEKTFVMSDPHGRLDCVISLLQGNGVINDQYQWSYGNNHLVVIGDVFDRGKDVMQIFWLLYKLEDEAAKAGGHVSFLLGNHEALVLSNDLRYTNGKYTLLAEKLNMKYPQLLGANTELGRWLGTRNTMQIVGNDLYVHAGLGKNFYDRKLDIPFVNEETSKALFISKKKRKKLSPLTEFLYGNEGPIWYRGLVKTDPKYKPLAQDSLQLILDRYNVQHIIVGHTIFKDISTFYQGRVIAVNVDNKRNKKKKRGRGILIDKGVYYIVGDGGILRKL